MNLLLVDDHPLFGVGPACALTTAAPEIKVITAGALALGLEIAAIHPELDIVLIEYHLGAHNGIEGLRRFGQQFPLVARVLVSGDETPTLLAAARAAGASGFIGKSQPLERMLSAVRVVGDGGLAFGSIPNFELPPVSTAATPQPILRQLEVLATVAHGQPNKRIAAALGIAERTVKLHMTALLAQLGAQPHAPARRGPGARPALDPPGAAVWNLVACRFRPSRRRSSIHVRRFGFSMPHRSTCCATPHPCRWCWGSCMPSRCCCLSSASCRA